MRTAQRAKKKFPKYSGFVEKLERNSQLVNAACRVWLAKNTLPAEQQHPWKKNFGITEADVNAVEA